MFRLATSHLHAILTAIINEMLARYGIPHGCTTVILIKRTLKSKSCGKIK
jgi:hypothetical protein